MRTLRVCVDVGMLVAGLACILIACIDGHVTGLMLWTLGAGLWFTFAEVERPRS